MEGSTSESALARIDAAIARLEAVAARPRDSGEDATSELGAKHERLRDAVAQSLRQLDGLIAGQNS